MDNRKNPLVSIIVPARNEEKNIEKCVNSLLSLNYQNVEIIIVNDGSTDRTGGILGGFNGRIKVIEAKGEGPSKARNLAISLSAGDYLAFTDADCAVDRFWIDELLKGFTDEEVFGVGGIQARPQGEGDFAKIVSRFFSTFGFVSQYIHSDEEMRRVEHNPTCNVMYRREIFSLMGGFREDLWPCEDLEFDIRAYEKGYVLVNNPKAVVYHFRPSSFKGFIRMMYRYGKAHSKLNSLHGFTELVHYIPLAVVVYFIVNVLLYNYIGNTLILINIIIFTFFIGYVLVSNRSLKKGLMVLGLFVSSIFSWTLGYFIGAGKEFWK